MTVTFSVLVLLISRDNIYLTFMKDHPLEELTKQAFLTWYQPVHEPFVKYCSSKCFGKISAEDLMQETILSTLTSFDQIKDKKKLLSYMMSTANNIIKNQLRRFKFSAPWDEDTMAHLESKGIDPELALDIQFLYSCIDRLQKNHKECILLFDISGFSIREISAIQQVSEQAVKTRLHRARKALKKLMSEEYSPSSIKSLLQVCSVILL